MAEASRKGWTKAEICSRAGIARTTLDGWETGRRRPGVKTVNRVADALGIDRGEALHLAGIITAVPDRKPDLPDELIDAYGLEVINAMMETVSDPAELQLLFDRLAEIRGPEEPPPSGPGAATPPGGTRRLA